MTNRYTKFYQETGRPNRKKSNHKWYVTMTDKFLSGWGHADGKINKLVIECDSLKEAEIVQDNARNRSEMKHININSSKPYYNPNNAYTSWHDKTDYSSWFTPGYFKK